VAAREAAGKDDGSALDLSRKALSLEVSPTVAVAQRAAAMKARGEAVLDFSVGEPDQPTPAHISAAAMAALQGGKTRYTQAAGIPELRAAVAQRYRKDYKLDFADNEVAITTGGKQALYLTCQALLDRGDEVIIPTPYWPTFSEAVRLAGARPILVQAQEKEGFKVTARMISKATSPRTKAVILNSPCNPTGAVIDAEDLLVIGDMAQRRKFTVLYDDTYAKLLFGKGPESALPALRSSIPDRFVIMGTASKTYCMTGWRIGWIMGPKALVDASAALISHSTQCPAAFAQVGAVEALNGPQKLVQDLAQEYKRRRDFIHAAVVGMPKVSCALPGGAFYVFPNVARYLGRPVATTLELASRLLEEQKVAVVPGEGFGAPGYLRISFARAMDDLQEGARRLGVFLQSLGAN
jgi:aspartate aminotransferase